MCCCCWQCYCWDQCRLLQPIQNGSGSPADGDAAAVSAAAAAVDGNVIAHRLGLTLSRFPYGTFINHNEIYSQHNNDIPSQCI